MIRVAKGYNQRAPTPFARTAQMVTPNAFMSEFGGEQITVWSLLKIHSV
jgi:hypothetical protein